jgi:hypothetical protein
VPCTLPPQIALMFASGDSAPLPCPVAISRLRRRRPRSAAVFLSRHKGDFPEPTEKLFEAFAVDAEPDEHRAIFGAAYGIDRAIRLLLRKTPGR